VLGNNVDKYKQLTDFHRYEAGVEFSQLTLRICQARYVIHNTPGFELGLHERIIEPLAHGTLVCAYNLPFATQEFKESQAVVSMQELSDIGLQDYTERQAAGLYQISMQHTWQHRWRSLLAQQGLL